jgi:4,5-DOPA dioxygenase extradiol
MYPDARIPVYQLSVDRNAPPEAQYETGGKIKPLRGEGVLILGSGNVVHNLAQVDFDKPDGYGWADEFDGYIRDAVTAKQYDKAIHHLSHAGPLLPAADRAGRIRRRR